MGALFEGVVGSAGELVQGQIFQNEQLHEARKAYQLDLFSLSLDILAKCREEVKDLFESYSGRVDTYLVVHTLLLSLGFAAVQYSDELVPDDETNITVLFLFVTLFSLTMIVPFFAIVLLLRVRGCLDHWFDENIRLLNREMFLGFEYSSFARKKSQESEVAETNQMGLIKELGNLLARCSESFEKMWEKKCKYWYDLSGILFWICCVMSLALIGIMMGHYFSHKYTIHSWIMPYFIIVLTLGAISSSIFLLPIRADRQEQIRTPLVARDQNRFDVD